MFSAGSLLIQGVYGEEPRRRRDLGQRYGAGDIQRTVFALPRLLVLVPGYSLPELESSLYAYVECDVADQ